MKRINPRRAKKHRAYSVNELADLLPAHKNTVHGWIKAGLPTVDGARPILIHGDDFQVWWAKRLKARKRPLKSGHLYCLKCREGKAPALGMVDYEATNAKTGNLKAMCETCGTMMHRRVRLADVAAKMPDLEVRRTVARPSIRERADPSPNTDNPAEA